MLINFVSKREVCILFVNVVLQVNVYASVNARLNALLVKMCVSVNVLPVNVCKCEMHYFKEV